MIEKTGKEVEGPEHLLSMNQLLLSNYSDVFRVKDFQKYFRDKLIIRNVPIKKKVGSVGVVDIKNLSTFCRTSSE